MLQEGAYRAMQQFWGRSVLRLSHGNEINKHKKHATYNNGYEMMKRYIIAKVLVNKDQNDE